MILGDDKETYANNIPSLQATFELFDTAEDPENNELMLQEGGQYFLNHLHDGLNARRTIDGNTALDVSILKKNEEFTLFLLNAGASITMPNDENITPLQLGLQSDNDFIKALFCIRALWKNFGLEMEILYQENLDYIKAFRPEEEEELKVETEHTTTSEIKPSIEHKEADEEEKTRGETAIIQTSEKRSKKESPVEMDENQKKQQALMVEYKKHVEDTLKNLKDDSQKQHLSFE